MPTIPQSSVGLAAYLSVCTNHFTGRKWVFAEIDCWLAEEDSRFFLIIGQPGSGKTTLAVRLVEFNDAVNPASAPDEMCQLQPGFLSASHFCRMQDYHLINPYSFAQELAGQLSEHPAFGTLFQEKLRVHNGNRPLAEIVQRIENVAEGAQVTAMSVGSLYLTGLSPQDTFDRLIHAPLTDTLRDSQFQNTPVVILVDGVDEALQFRRDVNIVSLLSGIQYLPPNVRFIVTTSPTSEVLDRLVQADQQVQRLWLDAEPGLAKSRKDIAAYLHARIDAIPELRQRFGPDCTRERFVAEVEERSQANFLYLHHLLKQLAQTKDPLNQIELNRLPTRLYDVYRDRLRRSVQQDPVRWADAVNVLGILSVEQEMMSERQLAQLSGLSQSELRRVLPPYESLLMIKEPQRGDIPEPTDRRYALYHPSFGQFLQDQYRSNEFWCEPGEQHACIANYFAERFQGFWERADLYSLRYTTTHYVNAVEQQREQPQRHQLAERLVELVLDQSFQAAHCSRMNNVALVRQLLELTLGQLVQDDPIDPTHSIVNVVRVALAFNEFRETYLQPSTIFAHAREGDIEGAQERLTLYPIAQRWIELLNLLIAWLAHQQAPDQAGTIIDNWNQNRPDDPILALMIDRIAVDLTDKPFSDLPPLPDLGEDLQAMEDLTRGIVKRMGGLQISLDVAKLCREVVEQVKDGLRATVGKNRDTAPVYVAEEDGPVLVAYVNRVPEKGKAYFEQYLRIHVTTPDRTYREESLWLLLESVLKHPNARWVQETLITIATEVLIGREQTFQEGLLHTMRGLKANIDPESARVMFEDERLEILINAAESALPDANDLWGFHKRRLACLAEMLVCLRNPLDPLWQRLPTLLLNIACSLVTTENAENFAGYRACAQLHLAETIHICHMEAVWPLHERLDEALRAAHNIRHPSFCACMTARVNAIKRWWSAAEQTTLDLENQIRQLTKRSESAQAATGISINRSVAGVHIIGESFCHRESPEKNKPPLPASYAKARSLHALLDVYGLSERELPRLRSLNKEIIDPMRELNKHQEVYIPDPGLLPLRAAWLAALVLASDQLSTEKQIRLIQSLVPFTIDNPTVLDTMLARLLIAAQPTDPQIWHALEAAVKPLEAMNVDSTL